jgi:hypothetical protein
MKWFYRLRFFLRPFLNRGRVHREMDEELRFHLEMEAEKLVAQGMDPARARREARMRFGAAEEIREEVRTVDGVSWMEKVLMDGRFGLRVLKKNPVFATVPWPWVSARAPPSSAWWTESSCGRCPTRSRGSW